MCDVSDYAIKMALELRKNKWFHVIYYASGYARRAILGLRKNKWLHFIYYANRS